MKMKITSILRCQPQSQRRLFAVVGIGISFLLGMQFLAFLNTNSTATRLRWEGGGTRGVRLHEHEHKLQAEKGDIHDKDQYFILPQEAAAAADSKAKLLAHDDHSSSSSMIDLVQTQTAVAAHATSSSAERHVVQPHIGYKKVLVTGGAGFVGSSVAAALLARGDDVVIVDEVNDYYDVRVKENNLHRLREMYPEENRLVIYRGDICDEDLMLQLFKKERPQWVCHMAARAGVRPSIQDPYVYIHSNIRGTTHLMELAHEFGVKNFVFASSSSVYGGSKNAFFSEEENVDNPISPYAASKKACELLAYTYHHLYQLNVTGLRFFTVYGPRGRPDMAPFKFIDRVSRGLELQQFGDGSSSRDYTYIDDIVDGVVRAIDRPYKYEMFNLGKGNGTSLKQFLDIVQKHVGKKAIIKIMPDQPGDVPYTCADVSKAYELLGYRATVPFDEGIRRTVDWYVNDYRKNISTEMDTQANGEVQRGDEKHFILPQQATDPAILSHGRIVDFQKQNDYAESHAIFLISFGQEAAESTLAERCILSLRRRGQWKGYIVLLTDASSSRYENVWSEKENVIVMHPKEEHFNGADGKPLAYNRETKSLKFKRFKTYVLDYFDMDQRLNAIETIYYLDIDMLAGDSISHLFSGIEAKEQEQLEHQERGAGVGLSTLHFFKPMTDLYPFQGGTFVVKRSSSKHCLELWRNEIDNMVGGNLGMDQAALRTVYQHIESGKETKCRLIRLDREDFISFPMPEAFDEIVQSSSFTTLIHLNKLKVAKWIDEEKQSVFLNNVLQLSDEEIEAGKYGQSITKFNLHKSK